MGQKPRWNHRQQKVHGRDHRQSRNIGEFFIGVANPHSMKSGFRGFKHVTIKIITYVKDFSNRNQQTRQLSKLGEGQASQHHSLLHRAQNQMFALALVRNHEIMPYSFNEIRASDTPSHSVHYSDWEGKIIKIKLMKLFSSIQCVSTIP